MVHAGIGADVEGFHAVAAAAMAGRVRELHIEPRRFREERFRELAKRVEASGGRVVEVDDVRAGSATSAPQGVVARCRPIETARLDDAIAATTPSALVVLDRIGDDRNVGAVARSAVAAGVGALVVSSDRAAPLGASAFKAAAGALETLPVVEVASVADAVRRLELSGVWTVGLDGTGDRSLFGLELLAEPVALVIGAEGKGLSRLVAERVSVVARMPMVGEIESLNASVAASLAMYELARVRGWLG